MPIYCYRCFKCGKEEEVLQHSMTDVECCGKQMDRKLFPSMFILKGEGGFPARVKQIRNTTYRIHPPLEHKPEKVYIG